MNFGQAKTSQEYSPQPGSLLSMKTLEGEKLNAIDLFSGYGGISLALREYVNPIIYCEIEKYAQAILISRMDDESIPFAPIWNDVTTLDGTKFNGLVDIIYGGFPCQDISVAGKGAGLEGKRSGLFYEVIRLCKEASPQFIFLENVPAIRTRGSIEVAEALAVIGYDCRFGVISAAEVGANHKRERWFCLASKRDLAHTRSEKLERHFQIISGARETISNEAVAKPCNHYGIFREDHWQAEPSVGRVVDGVANWSHRIKALGNGVVPLQVKTAFEKLMGIEYAR